MKILVTLPTGRVGSAIVKQLREQGIPHRLGAHNVEKARQHFPGAEVVPFDYRDLSNAKAALAGIDAVFLAQPGNLSAEPEKRLIDEAKAAGVRRMVKLSGKGAENHDEIALRQTEKHLEASGLEWTHLRPTWFMQNYSTMAADGIRRGTLAEPAAQAKTAFIDTRDIAAVAVKALTEDGHHGQAYTLSGPEALDRDQVAEKLSRALGREVRYVALTDEQFRQTLSAYAPPFVVERLLQLYVEVRSGFTGEVLDTVPRLLGRPALTFDQFAQDHLGAWA